MSHNRGGRSQRETDRLNRLVAGERRQRGVAGGSAAGRFGEIDARQRGRARRAARTTRDPSAGLRGLDQQINPTGPPPQGGANRAVALLRSLQSNQDSKSIRQQIADFFKQTPIGAAITGTEFQQREPGPLDVLPAGGTVAGLINIETAKAIAKRSLPTITAKLWQKIGSKGIPTTKSVSIASKIPVNVKTEKITRTWLERLGRALTNPTLVAASLIPIIGSYPFAGFIQEEALQTIDFGIRDARLSGNIELEEEAINFQAEILDADLWDNITSAIPFVNVVARLKEYKEAATLKLKVNTKMLNDRKIQIANGETESEKDARVSKGFIDRREERQADELAHEAQIDAQAAAATAEANKIFDARKEAGQADTIEHKKELAAIDRKNAEKLAEFWAEERKKTAAINRRIRDENAAFEIAYWEQVNKEREERLPSNLNFGGLF